MTIEEMERHRMEAARERLQEVAKAHPKVRDIMIRGVGASRCIDEELEDLGYDLEKLQYTKNLGELERRMLEILLHVSRARSHKEAVDNATTRAWLLMKGDA